MQQVFGELIPCSESDETRLRKYQNNIFTCSAGILIFCVWSLVKLCFYLMFEYSEYLEQMTGLALMIFFLLLAVLQGTDILLRFYIARSSKKYALGLKKKKTYLIACFFPGIASVFSIYTYIAQLYLAVATGYAVDTDVVLPFIIESTSIVVFVLLVVNTVRFGRCMKLSGKGV